MECKVEMKDANSSGDESFNRNIVECKVPNASVFVRRFSGF